MWKGLLETEALEEASVATKPRQRGERGRARHRWRVKKNRGDIKYDGLPGVLCDVLGENDPNWQEMRATCSLLCSRGGIH